MTGRHFLIRGASACWLACAALTLLVVAGLSACSSDTATATALPTATPSSVQIAIDRTGYTVTQAIGVTISNTSAKTDYYAVTGKSVCTYFQLEQYNASKNSWVPVDGCQSADQPRSLLIPHASSLPYTLAPYSTANQNQWAPGTYRISLQYTTDSTGSGGFQTAYSSGFTITGG